MFPRAFYAAAMFAPAFFPPMAGADHPPLDLCQSTVESLTSVRRSVTLNPARTVEALGQVRRTKVFCS